MILAAGFGTRMGGLTRDRPKPLIKVAGKPLLDHALTAAAEGGGPIAVNAHYRAGQIIDHLAGRDVHVLHETPDILDSGGGVRNALPILGDGPLATLNADAVWSGPGPISTLCTEWDAEEMDVLLLLVPRDRAVARQGGGDFALEPDGRVRPDTSGQVYTGAQILGGGLVARWPEGAFSMWDVWRYALARHRLFGCVYPGHWADVGHPDGIALAEAMLDV